jgi:hypothetical protein
MSKPARLATLLVCSLAVGIFTSLRTDDHDEFGDEMTWFASDWLRDDEHDEPAEGRETLAEGHWPLRGAEQRKLSSGSPPPRCEHTVDGRLALVDDRGFVCPHRMIGYDGCCNLPAIAVTRRAAATKSKLASLAASSRNTGPGSVLLWHRARRRPSSRDSRT